VIFIKLLSRLPLSALYLLADFLFFVSYYLIRYRREIVWKNLNNSFPEKSNQELRKIERDFYKYLADISVETVKLLTISEEDLLRRVKIDSSLTLHYNNLGYSIF
jgi:KDO2-lipid IV(A) lauroyltransferase